MTGQAPLDPDARGGDAPEGDVGPDSLRELLEAAGSAYRAGLTRSVPPGLESRVRAALARDLPTREQPSRRSRWYVATAALALLALGASLWSRPTDQAEAMPPEVLTAAALARMSAEAGASPEKPGTCSDASPTSPVHFPPVKDGSLRILRCEKKGDRTVARLYRPEELPSVGYVAVREAGAGTGPTIGMTDLGDLVVYDLAYGSKRHYLAVSRAFLDRERDLTPGRESCRACHNRSRVGQANPHYIVARSWASGG